MVDQKKILVSLLQERLVPVLSKKGFEQLPLQTERCSLEMRIAFPLGFMRRVNGKYFDLVEIQIDKRAAKFVINVGIAPPEGVNLPWGHFPQDKIGVSGLAESYRLYSSSRFMKWFSPSWFGLDPRKRMIKAVDKAIELLPEIEAWFKQREIGPHLRKFGHFQISGVR